MAKTIVDHSFFAQGLTPLCHRLSALSSNPYSSDRRCGFTTLRYDRIVVCRSQENIYSNGLDFSLPTIWSSNNSHQGNDINWFFWHLRNGNARLCQYPFLILRSDSSLLGHLVFCLPSWHSLCKICKTCKIMKGICLSYLAMLAHSLC